MAIGVKNVKKFALVPKMDQNVITCLVNVNVVLVITATTVMNYALLEPLEAAAQKYVCVALGHMTVIRSTAVAFVSPVTLDQCAIKVKIVL